MKDYRKFFIEDHIKKAMTVNIEPRPPWEQLIFEFRLLRVSKHMTMQALDEAAGTAAGKVSEFENGGNVTLKTLSAWAKKLGAEVQLISEAGMPNEFDHKLQQEVTTNERLTAKLEGANNELLNFFQNFSTLVDDKYDHRNNAHLRKLQRYLIHHGLISADHCVKI